MGERGMRVLICGGRDYTDRVGLFAAMENIDDKLMNTSPGITHVISGCARGADTLALEWARRYDLPVSMFPADWKRDGRAAGPIRNQRMIDEGKPDLVIAFPGGRGTADMVRRARSAGIEVVEVGDG